ncbi:hypothetical protein HID58_079668 [Brassica napus]|uniref:Uncharacterized protein n=1 Tax=Brassica napus TaxID=3708 RepID=A0ABQ7Y2N7_BRANA|nr:hypothetical protein HID58_079668 [Brassica napus]
MWLDITETLVRMPLMWFKVQNINMEDRLKYLMKKKQIQKDQRDRRKHSSNLPSTHLMLYLHVPRHLQDHLRRFPLMKQQDHLQLMHQEDHLQLVVSVDVDMGDLLEKDKHAERSFLGDMKSI